jgi:outer membrane protein assembly factor BamE (lipoprotein component of BamABCDE complex)
MKTITLALSIIAVAAAVAACAPVQLAKADVDRRIVCNADRMDQVERAARRENREVHWIHCPLATLRVAS